jgi:hypothetical protein
MPDATAPMEQPDERRSIGAELSDLRHSLQKYVDAGATSSAGFVADLTKAVHAIGDHLAALQRRVDRLEQGEDEWTTRGWEPPPGADRSPDDR